MNRRKKNWVTAHLVCAVACTPFGAFIFARTEQPISDAPTHTQEKEQKAPSPMVRIRYEDEDLVNFINTIAAHKQVNITLPLGANAIKSKLNFSIDRELTVDEAWERLSNILHAADYRLVARENGYAIVKNTKESKKEPSKHLFVNTQPDQLPDSDEFIRYLYYLKNMKLSPEGDNELEKVLKHIMPENTIAQLEPTSNSIIIAAPARSTRAAIRIIQALDAPGMMDKMDIVPLEHSSADIVANIFNEGILKQTDDFARYRLDNKKKGDSAYFPRNLRIVPDGRSNSLIIVGKCSAVDRVKQFILRYIDVELDSGKSIIHIYKLQYLNAEEFEPVLRKIVESTRSGGTEQSRTAATGGPDKSFEEVIIKADRPADPEKTKFHGGNNLIIVARNEDWRVIKKLIKDLDKPQPQIFIEILIADMSIDDTRKLGSLTRNPARLPMPSGLNFQSLQTTGNITTDENGKTIGVIDNPERAVADLLRLKEEKSEDGSSTSRTARNIPNTPGATTISISDASGETWSILNLLKVFKHSKVLSHPHVVATHNKEAVIKSGEVRILEGQVVTGENNNSFRKQEPVPANTTVKITPRINYRGDEEDIAAASINLNVEVTIDEFKNDKGDKNTRKVVTNTSVSNNGILALGGLIRTKSDQTQSETPVLGRIPILGWFFKGRSGEHNKTNLTIFIRPTVLEPQKRSIADAATQDYIAIARLYAGEGALFDSLRDPVTRWFFGKDTDLNKSIDQFTKDKKLLVSSETATASNHAPSVAQKKTDAKPGKLKRLLKGKSNPFSRS